MLLTHARVKHLSFPTARYFSTAARAPPRVRERAWRQAWGRWPAADVGRRARARPAWHDDVEGLLCFWWCACRRTTGVSRPLSRRRDRAAAANEEPTRKPVAGFMYVVARTQYKEDSRPSRFLPRVYGYAQRSPVRAQRAETGVVLLSCGMCGRGTRWRWADTPGTLSTLYTLQERCQEPLMSLMIYVVMIT
jgi:hypothetical protein